jgi:hypothetical protein
MVEHEWDVPGKELKLTPDPRTQLFFLEMEVALCEADDCDDLPRLSPRTILENPELSKTIHHYQTAGTFSTDSHTLDAALRQLVSSGDAQSGEMLNYMYEAGIPAKRAQPNDEPLATLAARQWTSPSYVDILATLVEFNHDFDEVTEKHPRSARSIVEERAPGLFQLIRLKAHLVEAGSWPGYATMLKVGDMQ